MTGRCAVLDALIEGRLSPLSAEVAVFDTEPDRWSETRFQPARERKLYPHVVEVSATVRGNPGDGVLIPEFVGPIGVPDFVLLLPDDDALRRRFDLTVPPLLREIDAAVVSALSYRYARGVDEVSERIGWRPSSIRRRVPDLRRSGALTVLGDGRMRTVEGLEPVGTIHSFEAKLRDWHSAVWQARKYGLWADYSTIVLGEDAPQSRVDIRVAELGLGYVRCDRWQRRPRRKPVPDRMRMWASEHVVATLRNSDQ